MPRYKSVHTGPQIDSGVARALPGGEIDAALDNKMEIEFLDNVDFTNPVAQAGIGGLHGSVAYAVDRWKLLSGTVSWDSNGLTLNGTIRQIREFPIGFPVVPSIEMYSGTATITYDDVTKYCDITSSGGTIKRAHLGLIEITDWSKVPQANYELQKCLMYYFRKHFLQHETVGLGYVGESWVTLMIGIGSKMRSDTPSVKLHGSFAFAGASPTASITSLIACTCSGAIANVGTSAIASTQGACYAFPPDSGGATIEIINDL